jgi:trigger factor
MTVEVEVDPEIDIKGYDNTGITVPATAVHEEEVQAEFDRLSQMWSKDEPVDREAKKGDLVVGNYIEVVINGEKQELPENKEFRSLLGESASPGFDEGLMGVKAGDKKEINFKYPDDHKDERYRGKTAQFNVEITSVREIVPPTFDEEFCKQIGVKDVEELKSNLAESLANQKQDAAKTKAINEAIDKLIESNPFDVPNARVVDLIRWSINRNAQSEKDMVEPTEEQIKTLSPEAVREIKKHRILDFVATKEKLKASQAQVDERLKLMADNYHVAFDELKNHFRQSGRINQLRDELRFQMAADFIVGIRPAAEETK